MAGIKKGTAKNISERKEIERVNPDYRSGLSEEQVRERTEAGWDNREVDAALLSTADIIKKNVFTYFNLIFTVLAILLCLVGSFRDRSGVGLVNVNNRIKILFGKEYGLTVESEPDEGTRVSICIPEVPYTEENRKKLEEGNIFSIEDTGEIKRQGDSHEK